MNFDIIILTQNSFYGISDSEEGRVVAQRIATRNLFGVSLNHEPLYIGVLWKKNQEGQLVVLDEKNTSILKTTKIIKIFEAKG